MGKTPVFVIITSTTCGACNTFKTRYRMEVMSRLKDEGRVEIVEINFPNMKPVLDNRYHPDLIKFIPWYPLFIIFTGESWENHSTPLMGEIMYAKYEGGRYSPEMNQPINAETIILWVNKKISEHPYV